jgi:hypothetical protein
MFHAAFSISGGIAKPSWPIKKTAALKPERLLMIG